MEHTPPLPLLTSLFSSFISPFLVAHNIKMFFLTFSFNSSISLIKAMCCRNSCSCPMLSVTLLGGRSSVSSFTSQLLGDAAAVRSTSRLSSLSLSASDNKSKQRDQGQARNLLHPEVRGKEKG